MIGCERLAKGRSSAVFAGDEIGAGCAGPLAVTPVRRRPSLRRTITVDGHRPDGPRGAVVIDARGRDLRTGAEAETDTLDRQTVRMRSDYIGDQRVLDLHADPAEERLAALVGGPSRSGFRAAMQEIFRDAPPGSLLVQLLDELPAVPSLSRLALIHAGTIDLTPGSGDPLARSRPPNTTAIGICAGWAPGTAMAMRIQDGRSPVIRHGVASPAIVDPDPISWHEVDALPPGGFRRSRRLDMWPDSGSDDSLVEVQSHFRDTYRSVTGDDEMIVHEYEVAATLNRASGIVVDCAAQARVLPAPECPRAASSAHRLAGLKMADVRETARDEMEGESTCTHLNDQLGAIGVFSALLPCLPRR